MPPTVIRGKQVLDGSIQRADLDVSTVGQAVIAKLVQGAGITLSSTGADSGTGDVTISGGTGDMLKSVYDTNGDGISDHAALADAAPWTGITGTPSTFAPSAHQSSHVSGADQIPNASASTRGLLAQLSGTATDYVGGNNLCYPVPFKTFVTATSATTLTTLDSGKYIICSGGSWNLWLPSSQVGLLFVVRNDQTCFGTTGTITIIPAIGTIDGLASLPLLPQQECTLICDGTNWRTFGLQREVILGTQDITSATANASVLLPVGFRYFELVWNACLSSAANALLGVRLSPNGGSTWWQSGYDYGLIYPSSPTAIAYSQATGQTAFTIGTQVSLNNGTTKLLLYPGSATTYPTWIGDSTGWRSTDNVVSVYRSQGFWVGNGLANALQYYFSAGNITNSFLTVKGVV
jgi:hypothetical protein